jgi:3-oxoacyl-[acyl-carrier protein] reductase
MKLEGKRAIVTGGASGVGAAAVRAYVREGASVVSFDIDDELGRTVVEEATKAGPGGGCYRHCDIGVRDDVEVACREAVRDLGGLDILVNLAGTAHQCPAEEISEAQCRELFQVHYYGTMFTNQAAFRAMRAGSGGSIVNCTSVAGVRGFKRMADYGAAKAAVLGWTRSVAMEWGHDGVRVNALCPNARTPMSAAWEAEASAEDRDAWQREVERSIHYGRREGDPDADVAPVIVFLGSDDSHFITGQIIAVNGGLMMVS